MNNKIECSLCKKEIDKFVDKYVHIEDWECEKMIKDIWCHRKCFNEGMNRELTELQKQAQSMLAQTGQIVNQYFPTDRVVNI